MAECEKLAICPFFNSQMTAMPAVEEMMKKRYCLSNKLQCARYQVSSAGLQAPPDLFPHERDRARELLLNR
jgi:hypothetical protein